MVGDVSPNFTYKHCEVLFDYSVMDTPAMHKDKDPSLRPDNTRPESKNDENLFVFPPKAGDKCYTLDS